MERLTFDGNFCMIARCLEFDCSEKGCTQKRVWDQLKYYEDNIEILLEWAERRLEGECLNGDGYTQSYWRGYRDALRRLTHGN